MKQILNRKQSIILGSAVLFVIIIACIVILNYDSNAITQNVDLYFLNEDGTNIVAESDTVRYKNDSELIADIIEELREGPSLSNRGRIMPKTTQLNRVEFFGDKSVSVDLSEEFISEDSSKNVLAVYAITKSICSTGKILSVQVTVKGKGLTDRDGNELGFVAASDINLETEEYSSEMREVILYFANADKTGLVSEVRTVMITDQQPIEQYIIKELIKGPEDETLHSVLSGETVLTSVELEDNICYLNFKSEFLTKNAGGSDHEKLVIYSIVNSLTELQNIARVQFYMDGKRVDSFGSFYIKDYIERDNSIISD